MLLWQLARGDSPLIVNVPHAGCHVPDAIALRVHALQLEMVQASCPDESRPTAFDPARAAALVDVLERLVLALTEWRPQRGTR